MTETTDRTKGVTVREAPIKPPLVAGGGAGGITPIVPRTLEEAYRLAQAIAAADMAPKAYARDANRIMVGILHGLEVGLTPMAALQSIAVINGMPTIFGDGMLGIVRASGLLESFHESIEGKDRARVAVCRVKRRGEPEPIERRFSWAQAELAGLDKKPGPWSQYPDRMFSMRARSWALRDGFADVLRGLSTPDDRGEGVNLGADAEGTYVPRPVRAQYEAPPPDMDRAYKAAMGEYVDDETGEIAGSGEGAEGSVALHSAPEPEGRAAGDDLDRPSPVAAPTFRGNDPLDEPPQTFGVAAPTLLPTKLDAEGKIDWQPWLIEAKTIIASAPNADWIGEWMQVHTSTLGSLRTKSPKTHETFMAHVNAARAKLATSTS